MEIDHQNTDEIVCTYCGEENENPDSGEIPLESDSGKSECEKCGKTFLWSVEMIVKYSTEKIQRFNLGQRIEIVNNFVKFLHDASGMRFYHKGIYANLFVKQGVPYWVDEYSGKEVKLKGGFNDWHNKICHGSGVRCFIEYLRDFALYERLIPICIFEHWGMSEEQQEKVLTEGRRVGILES
jgi:hypothetical protein